MKHWLHATLFYLQGENSRCPLGNRPCARQGRSEPCDENKVFWALPEREPGFLAKLACVLFAVLSHFCYELGQKTNYISIIYKNGFYMIM
jgi:hypothetical protein